MIHILARSTQIKASLLFRWIPLVSVSYIRALNVWFARVCVFEGNYARRYDAGEVLGFRKAIYASCRTLMTIWQERCPAIS